MDVSPGWPVALCLVILLSVTVAANRAGRLGLARQSVLAGVRAVLQLSLVALVISGVVGSLWLSFVAVVAMFAMAVVTTSRRIDAPRTWPWAAAAMACGVVPVVAIILACASSSGTR